MPRAELLRGSMLNDWYHQNDDRRESVCLRKGKIKNMAYDLGLADRIRRVLGRHGDISERKMFGGLCFMVNGHMCCGIVNSDLMLRLTPEIAAASLREPHTRPMDFTGKPMKSMIYVDACGIDSDDSLTKWVRSAEQVARGLPEKQEKPRNAPSKARKTAS